VSLVALIRVAAAGLPGCGMRVTGGAEYVGSSQVADAT
jgi:hypothetical protein